MKTPSPRAVFIWGLLLGVFFDQMYWMIWFDLTGLEQSIAKIRENWIDSNTTMPIQIVAVVTVGMFALGFWHRLPAKKPAPN
jgi:hypothetical protein